MNVDFPAPEGPTIYTNSLRLMVTVMPRSAAVPSGYVFQTSCISITLSRPCERLPDGSQVWRIAMIYSTADRKILHERGQNGRLLRHCPGNVRRTAFFFRGFCPLPRFFVRCPVPSLFSYSLRDAKFLGRRHFFAKNVRQRKKRPKVAGSDTRPL